MGENPLPATTIEISLGRNLRALLRGEAPAEQAEGSEPDLQVPDFPPEEWGELAGEEPPG